MAYERLDGSIRMLARTSEGELAESLSRDGGRTWSEARLSGIANPGSRFFISRTPSGRVLLINNDCRTGRTHMTVSLSEDDGVTWTCRKLIDNRNWVSYPDADFYGGRIYMTYDRDRLGAKEILFLSFREEDIMDDEKPLCPQTVSRPDGGGSGPEGTVQLKIQCPPPVSFRRGAFPCCFQEGLYEAKRSAGAQAIQAPVSSTL